jgi:hypothetical protein
MSVSSWGQLHVDDVGAELAKDARSSRPGHELRHVEHLDA